MNTENLVLKQVANEVVTKDHIIGYLDVVKNNLNMSVLNQAMIYLQRPHAKMVCGKKAWEIMGRTINQNALPIVLFFPSITMTEPAEEFKIDNVAQAVGNTDVSMYSKEAVYDSNYLPVNAFDFDSTTGADITEETYTDTFIDTIIEITGCIPESVETALLNGKKGKYEKKQNVFYYSNNIKIDTEYGKQEYNKTMLDLYVDYVFDNYNITDKTLKCAVLYVIYEHYNISNHNIEKPLFIKLDKKTEEEKLYFITDLQWLTSGIVQDFDGYYLNFNETALINDLLYTSTPSKIWIMFDKIIMSIDDDILKDELDRLKIKLMRAQSDFLEVLQSLRMEKKLYSYPPTKIVMDKRDYLRKERMELLCSI